MSDRRRTAFADILKTEPLDQTVNRPDAQHKLPNLDDAVRAEVNPGTLTAKKNKAVSADYTKLTAYVPRTLAAAIKMSMALDLTTDQSKYIEHALTEWLRSRGREGVLSQAGYK